MISVMGLKRDLSEAEKQQLVDKYGLKCFVDDHPVKSKDELEFHHVVPFSEGGSSDLQNMAPVCKEHHKRLGTLSLSEFRDKLAMERFFEKKREAYLDDVIKEKIGEANFAKEVTYELAPDNAKLYFSNKGWLTFPLHKCPVTGTNYFYATVPVEYLLNDKELQPRFLIPSKLWALYSHFRRYTQLAPSICRLKDKRILLFDGQHKATPQIWFGRKEVECKIYVDPNEVAIKEANIAAHTALRQMSLYTSIAVRRLSDLFGDYWEEFEKVSGQKSEELFVSFLESKGKKRSEAVEMYKAEIYDSILESQDSHFAKYVSKETRTYDMPFSVFMLQKSVFANLVVSPPLDEDLEIADVWRDNERKNIVTLLNILAEETLDGKWNPKSNDSHHRKAERIYGAGCMRAWSKMLKDMMAASLRIFDQDKRERLIFNNIQTDTWSEIRSKVKKFFSHKIWEDPRPEIEAQLKLNDVSAIKQVFEREGLTVNWVLGFDT